MALVVAVPVLVLIGLLLWLNSMEVRSEAAIASAKQSLATLEALQDLNSEIFSLMRNYSTAKINAVTIFSIVSRSPDHKKTRYGN